MTEDDIAKLRSLIPDDFKLPDNLTQEELMKLHMVCLNLAMQQVRESQIALARFNKLMDQQEAQASYLSRLADRIEAHLSQE